MSFRVKLSENFIKEAKRLSKKYPSLKGELALLGAQLASSPVLGTSLGNDVYKIRIAVRSKGRGKSGGARVITFVKISEEIVLLLSIYDKGQKSTITESEIKALLKEFL